jgi:quercetin dioxygenase-like cupin family protein
MKKRYFTRGLSAAAYAAGSIFKVKVSGRGMHLIAIGVFAVISTIVAYAITPGSGAVGEILVRAGFVDKTDVRFKVKDNNREVIQANNAGDTAMQKITIAPGGHTGWHSHPGPVVVLIESGEMTFYDGDDPTCTARTFVAGQAFIDKGQGHEHIAFNQNASEPLVLYATYFDIPPGQSFRIDVPVSPGNCAF